MSFRIEADTDNYILQKDGDIEVITLKKEKHTCPACGIPSYTMFNVHGKASMCVACFSKFTEKCIAAMKAAMQNEKIIRGIEVVI